MIIYSLYIFILYILRYIWDFSKKSSEDNSYRYNIFILDFVFMFLIFALRHQNMGIDLNNYSTYGYLGSFDIISGYSWNDIVAIDNFLNYEKGYVIYNKIVAVIYPNRQFFLAITAFLILFPTFYIIRKYSCDYELSIVILMGIPMFLQYFSGLRQALAVAFCIYSFDFIIQKKLTIFIVIILFAFCFHSSSLVFLMAYPLYYIKINKKIRWISLFLLSLIWIYRVVIFPTIARIFNKNVEIIDTKSINLLIVFVLIYLLCFIFADNNILENGWLNYLFVTCFIQIFANINNIAMRAGYYYMFFLTLLLPSILTSSKFIEMQRKWLSLGVFIFFYIFCWYSLTTSQSARAVPYYFFWENPNI